METGEGKCLHVTSTELPVRKCYRSAHACWLRWSRDWYQQHSSGGETHTCSPTKPERSTIKQSVGVSGLKLRHALAKPRSKH